MDTSNIQQNTGKANDEIDIFEFCARMWGAFKNFLSSTLNFFVTIIIFLIRKSLWIVSFTLAGFLIGYLLYSTSVPVFSSWMEGNTGDLDNRIVIDHINRLNQVTGNNKLLAEYLNIKVEQAEQISSIGAFYGIDINRDKVPDFIDFNNSYNPRDTGQVRLPSFIYIKVTVFDETILPALRNGLIQYIDDSPYIQEFYNISRRQKLQTIAEIQTEIEKIDSLQRSQFRKMPDNLQTLLLNNQSVQQLFHNEVLWLHSTKQNLELSLLISDEIITVVHDFMPLSEEVAPITRYVMIYGFVMGFLSIFAALIWQYRKKIWKLIIEG